MAKTQEELIQLKNECETLTTKLKELTEEELKEVTGGAKFIPIIYSFSSQMLLVDPGDKVKVG